MKKSWFGIILALVQFGIGNNGEREMMLPQSTGLKLKKPLAG